MTGYTYYKDIKDNEELRDYFCRTGDLPDCESFQILEEGDNDKIKDTGFIAEENFDDELWLDLPETLSECL